MLGVYVHQMAQFQNYQIMATKYLLTAKFVEYFLGVFMLSIRPRRNRISESVRSLVREHSLSINDLVMPLFIIEGNNQQSEISSMPGIYRLSTDRIIQECEILANLGVKAVVLFPALPESIKDKTASESWNDSGLYQQTIRTIKKEIPELVVMTDVAMDPYSSDGHDGYVSESGEILNDDTLEYLGKMALSQAHAGADIVSPSDMMDGRVGYIRSVLDESGFTNVGILAYTAKYASGFYGPFREALDSAPKKGDKKTYQMDPANQREAIRELELDISEGADMVMVKPGLPYLDIVKLFSELSSVPVAVYNVSGEYAMVKAAAQNGWIDEYKVTMEILTGFKRAGADMILSYHTKQVAQWLKEIK